MAVSDEQLDQVVQDWNTYVSKFLAGFDSIGLLAKKNLSMYMALGVTRPEALSSRLVQDYVASSIENTMGHLYELALGKLGPVKITNQQKKQDGYEGLDFVQITPTEIRLVDLASASNTKNGGARIKSRDDMARASEHWEFVEQQSNDDNPMVHVNRKVVRIWAVARGTSARSQADGILRLRGDAMWEYFGAGPGCLARIGQALARNPVTGSAFHDAVSAADRKLQFYLSARGLADGEGNLKWPEILTQYP